MKKYLYKFKQNLKTSMDIGEITPIYWDTLYPGESIKKINFENLTRMITPIYPTLDSPKIELYAFAIPKRIIFLETPTSNNKFDNINLRMETAIIDKLNQETDSSEKIINTNSVAPGSNLLKKFGIDFGAEWDIPDNSNKIKIKIDYLLAYWKVYEQFFKQKQIEVFNYNNFYRYLTADGKLNDLSYKSFQDANIPDAYFEVALKTLNKIAMGNTDNDYLNELTFDQIDIKISNNWNAFKKHLSDYYKKNKKILNKIDEGTIKDELIAVWNANNQDKTNPILLGYQEFYQSIQQVVNTTQSQTNALGEIGGMSVTFNQGNLINNYTANEETIILILALPNYKMSLKGAFEYEEWNSDSEVYSPYVEYLQIPRTGEFISSNPTNESYSSNALGYVPPFNYLRQKKDIIAGEIINKWSNWTYVYEVNTDDQIEINTNLLKINKKPFKDTLISPNQDSFICEYNFKVEQLRTIKPLAIIEEELIKGE